jgi:hypothetical protein
VPQAPWERRGAIVLAALVALAFVYTLHRAVSLRIEYHDGYEYLMNSRALLGDRFAAFTIIRPPFLSLAQLPAVALARRGPPGGLALLLLPHLTSAFLSLLTAGVVFRVYRPALGTTLAGLGTLLLVTTPLFVRYGAHAIADIPSAGWTAAAVGLYLRARDRRSAGAYALCGVALGGAVLTKYPLVTVILALATAELAYGLRDRRVDGRGWAGLVLAGAVAAAFFVAVNGAVIGYRDPGEARLHLRALRGFWLLAKWYGATHHESWRDYAQMSVFMLSVPTLVLAAVGLARAVAERNGHDVAFLAWLAVVGGSIVFGIGHTEARYLLPAVPAVVYFAARGAGAVAGWRPGGLARTAAVALVGWAVWSGVQQAILDRDPVFRSDVERRATLALLHARRPGGRLLWLGALHTFHTRDPAPMPADEYFDTFHYAPLVASYLLGERVQPLRAAGGDPDALVALVQDGDAILRAADREYETRTLPPEGVPPPEVWAVHRLALRPAGDGASVGTADGAVSLRVAHDGGGVRLTPAQTLGAWSLFVADAADRPTPLGRFELRAGEPIAVGGSVHEVPGVVLLRIDRTVVE